MEFETNLNYSTAHFPITTEAIIGKEKTVWTKVEIARLIQVIVRPILVVVGTIGNSLSFYIMRRTSLKDGSSCFYMAVLALADTCKYIAVTYHS